MSTAANWDPVGSALFPKSRREVLHLLYGHPDRAFYVREIVQRTGLGPGHVQRELERLRRGGILVRTEQGRHVYFQANRACPVREELRSLVTRTGGVAGRLRAALGTVRAPIDVALVYGSVARGEERESSDIDLLVIGAATLAEVVSAVRPLEASLGREITPTVYTRPELRAKAGRHFLRSVLKAEKVFVLGDERELGRLLAERVDPGA